MSIKTNVMLPIIRNVVPGLIASQLTSVQPMTSFTVDTVSIMTSGLLKLELSIGDRRRIDRTGCLVHNLGYEYGRSGVIQPQEIQRVRDIGHASTHYSQEAAAAFGGWTQAEREAFIAGVITGIRELRAKIEAGHDEANAQPVHEWLDARGLSYTISPSTVGIHALTFPTEP